MKEWTEVQPGTEANPKKHLVRLTLTPEEARDLGRLMETDEGWQSIAFNLTDGAELAQTGRIE